MSIVIVIPDFNYTGQYYPEFLEDLIQFLRTNAPELSDEDPVEPHIQIIRAQALAAHLNAVLTDLVANEMYLPTAKLRASVKALLKLIGQDLKQAAPASVDLLVQLSQTFTAVKTTVPAGSVFSTLENRAAQVVEYEALEDVDTVARTDRVGYVYSYDANLDTYTDHTTDALAGGAGFTPNWVGAPAAGDILYIGHAGVLWNKTRIDVDTAATGITTAVWEYFDGDYDQGKPDSVTNLGSTLRFVLNGVLGTADRTGTQFRVRSALTGAYQDLTVTFTAGENRITTSGADAFLGQAVPSTTVSDYIVGGAWRELEDVVDPTTALSVLGDEAEITYTLPQTLEQNWRQTTVATGSLAAEAYWLRYRIIAAAGATAPDLSDVLITEGEQYQVLSATQGRSREDDPLGSSDGSADQQFTLSTFPVIDDDNVEVTVTESGVDKTYTRVTNFLNSVGTDRHYTLEFDDDGHGIISFGDGTNGKIPPAGVNNIKVTYRTMDAVDGNVGADTIDVNRSGVAYIATVTNPRAAAGFAVAEGSTDEDLARVKIAAPAALRAQERAVSPQDAETVATQFVAADGSKPIARALAIEESFGPKTVEVVCVGTGGAQVPADKLSEVETFFNGDDDTPGRILFNTEATPTNFSPLAVDITATVKGGNATAILTALTALLNPLAKKADGTWAHEFGGEVTLARLYQVVMDTSPPPTDVTFATPVANVDLATRELPTVGTLTITVTE